MEDIQKKMIIDFSEMRRRTLTKQFQSIIKENIDNVEFISDEDFCSIAVVPFSFNGSFVFGLADIAIEENMLTSLLSRPKTSKIWRLWHKLENNSSFSCAVVFRWLKCFGLTVFIPKLFTETSSGLWCTINDKKYTVTSFANVLKEFNS